MQDAVAFVLITAAVVVGGYLIIEIGTFMLEVVFGNQSTVIAAPLP